MSRNPSVTFNIGAWANLEFRLGIIVYGE